VAAALLEPELLEPGVLAAVVAALCITVEAENLPLKVRPTPEAEVGVDQPAALLRPVQARQAAPA
jgi:hypothetical protein